MNQSATQNIQPQIEFRPSPLPAEGTVSAPLMIECVPVTRTYSSFGVRVEVAVSSIVDLAAFERSLPAFVRPTTARTVSARIALRAPGRCACGASHDQYEVFAPRQLDRNSKERTHAIGYARAALKLHVAEFAPRRVFVHAGVVDWNGQAILLPGRAHSGKTTLVSAFLAAGASYLSDDFAVLDHHGLVHAYPQPLGIRRDGSLHQQDVEPGSLGAEIASVPVKVGLVIATRFAPGSAWRPERLTPGETVLSLLSHTVSAQRQPARAIETLKRATATATGLRGERGDADSTVQAILLQISKD